MDPDSPLSQFTFTEPTPGYWRVVYANPPINLLNSTTVLELAELVQRLRPTCLRYEVSRSSGAAPSSVTRSHGLESGH
jgi:hypothetical protein